MSVVFRRRRGQYLHRIAAEDQQLPAVGQQTLRAGLKGLANIVLLGKLFAVCGFCSRETLDAAIEKCVPPRKAALIEKNKQAIDLGMEA